MGQRTVRDNQGVAMVELAIALPVLLIIMFAIIEFGFVFYNKAVITNASREGARAGIVYREDPGTGADRPYTLAEIQAVVNAYLDGGNVLIPTAAPSITAPDGLCPGNTAALLRVRVEYAYPFFVLPNLVTSITGPVNLVGETIMRCDFK